MGSGNFLSFFIGSLKIVGGSEISRSAAAFLGTNVVGKKM
jgi:hypothetical protein